MITKFNFAPSLGVEELRRVRGGPAAGKAVAVGVLSRIGTCCALN
ncbi:hypothetical protein [Ralstonia solanacearum]|nr:hypothetical protein [Ralstonia solanacearum]